MKKGEAKSNKKEYCLTCGAKRDRVNRTGHFFPYCTECNRVIHKLCYICENYFVKEYYEKMVRYLEGVRDGLSIAELMKTQTEHYESDYEVRCKCCGRGLDKVRKRGARPKHCRQCISLRNTLNRRVRYNSKALEIMIQVYKELFLIATIIHDNKIRSNETPELLLKLNKKRGSPLRIPKMTPEEKYLEE